MTKCTGVWLEERATVNERNGKVELMLRPFLRWFDRSLEDLVTSGLKQVATAQMVLTLVSPEILVKWQKRLSINNSGVWCSYLECRGQSKKTVGRTNMGVKGAKMQFPP